MVFKNTNNTRISARKKKVFYCILFSRTPLVFSILAQGMREGALHLVHAETGAANIVRRVGRVLNDEGVDARARGADAGVWCERAERAELTRYLRARHVSEPVPERPENKC